MPDPSLQDPQTYVIVKLDMTWEQFCDTKDDFKHIFLDLLEDPDSSEVHIQLLDPSRCPLRRFHRRKREISFRYSTLISVKVSINVDALQRT